MGSEDWLSFFPQSKETCLLSVSLRSVFTHCGRHSRQQWRLRRRPVWLAVNFCGIILVLIDRMPINHMRYTAQYWITKCVDQKCFGHVLQGNGVYQRLSILGTPRGFFQNYNGRKGTPLLPYHRRSKLFREWAVTFHADMRLWLIRERSGNFSRFNCHSVFKVTRSFLLNHSTQAGQAESDDESVALLTFYEPNTASCFHVEISTMSFDAFVRALLTQPIFYVIADQ